jgi:precorrin-2 dehydrogenase/sirohydrochlorin ferrochelatase
MLPLFLNLNDRLCVVVGGGPVGRRRAAKLRRHGARVRLVCLEKPPEEDVDPKLEWITAPYRPEHLDAAFLIFAAASASVNQQVVADARARHLLVNSATEPGASDFQVPAVLERGSLALAISTGGRAPGLAREVRLLLDESLAGPLDCWLDIVAELRADVRQRVADEGRRREILARLCRRIWLGRLAVEGVEEVRRAMRAEVEALVNQSGDSV